MPVEFYADYMRDLRTLLAELDGQPERFQTYDVHIELAAAGKLVVYETKRQKGQTDSLYYGRSGTDESPRRMTQAAAFAAIDHFMGLGQFLAFNGHVEDLKARNAADALPIGVQYPSCAVSFAYRKKGQPKARAMFMIFVGFNDDQDAERYAAGLADPSILIDSRPLRAGRVYEWR